MHTASFPDGIYLVDFEFHPAGGREGNPPVPVCMVVREWPSGCTQRYWQADLHEMATAPFPTGDKALCVAYYASAEVDCFHALGWPHPVHVLDLFTEFRCLTNGLRLAHGSGLLGALLHYDLPSIAGEQKDAMRDLVLTGGPWSNADQLAILDYCETDVVALAHLLTAMQDQIDWPRALLRGRYMKAVSCIQTNGIPIDTTVLALLQAQWSAIQDQLITDVDSDYGIFEGRTFKSSRWEAYLVAQQIAWPRLPSGALDMCDATFREMARAHLQVAFCAVRNAAGESACRRRRAQPLLAVTLSLADRAQPAVQLQVHFWPVGLAARLDPPPAGLGPGLCGLEPARIRHCRRALRRHGHDGGLPQW
jgi:hypothetical protein